MVERMRGNCKNIHVWIHIVTVGIGEKFLAVQIHTPIATLVCKNCLIKQANMAEASEQREAKVCMSERVIRQNIKFNKTNIWQRNILFIFVEGKTWKFSLHFVRLPSFATISMSAATRKIHNNHHSSKTLYFNGSSTCFTQTVLYVICTRSFAGKRGLSRKNYEVIFECRTNKILFNFSNKKK